MFDEDLSKPQIPKELLDEILNEFGEFDVKLWKDHNKETDVVNYSACKSFKSHLAGFKGSAKKKILNCETGEFETKDGEYFDSYKIRMEFPELGSNLSIQTLRKVEVIRTFQPYENQ